MEGDSSLAMQAPVQTRAQTRAQTKAYAAAQVLVQVARTEFKVSEADIKESIYIEGDVLGHGAFGKVFKSQSAKGMKVAKKVICKRKGAKTLKWQRGSIQREVRTLRRCSGSPNVAAFEDSYEIPSAFIIVTEYAGPSLLDYLNATRGSHRATGEIRIIMRQVLEGVAYINGQGYIHRDIKPENICVRKGGADGIVIKVIDLGLSVRFRGRTPEEKVVLRVETGTYGYMAPEIYGPHSYNEKADAWSCGIVLLVILDSEGLVMKSRNFSINGAKTSARIAVAQACNQRSEDDGVPGLLRALLEPEPHKRMDAAQARAECRLFQ